MRRRPWRYPVAVTMATWTLVGLMLATQAYLAGVIRGEPVPWTRPLLVWMPWAYGWAVLTPLVWRMAEWVPIVHPRLARALAIHAAAAVVVVTLDLALFATMAPWLGAVNTTPSWAGTFSKLFGTTFLLHLPVYVLIVGTAHVARAMRLTRDREQRSLRLETQLADARLAALRAQLEPHFLFNALNTIAVLMREDVDAAERVLVRLSSLLRRTLEASDTREIPLRDELAFVEAYLAVESARFDDRLSYAIEVAPEWQHAAVPCLILQPLVENAVRHGLAERGAPLHITIQAHRRDDSLVLRVKDDGAGMVKDAADGIGLSNTRSRLALLYGPCQSVSIDSASARGVTVTLTIPWRTAGTTP
ncbi:sensor histidine kinase [Tahibacter amnicola]|uniref:histidine kinase n=1 Tax=Tahibacter amnicola TaxID=2976241 RepID=A0ABY6B7N0_9GAMM|nr:histidine kinase [Tahibacter amnicola]UXI65777.1 histidine kinase [Tahibacter amnicola]